MKNTKLAHIKRHPYVRVSSVCRQSTKTKRIRLIENVCLSRSRVTFNGNEHRKQAKQRRKRAFVNSLKTPLRKGCLGCLLIKTFFIPLDCMISHQAGRQTKVRFSHLLSFIHSALLVIFIHYCWFCCPKFLVAAF